MIPDSGIILWLVKLMSSCWRIRSAIDSIAVFQYHTPTIQENIFENTDFEQAIQFFCKLKTFGLSLGSKKSKKYVYELLQKEHKAFKIRQAFLVLSCDQLWSHLKSSWLINQRSKDTAL